MARYFFHVVNDRFRTDDEIGAEFTTLAAARRHACVAVGQILADELASETALIHLTVLIDDERGECVASLTTVTTLVSNDGPVAA